MSFFRWLCLAALCVTLAFTAGCSSNSNVENKTATTGQELKDLDEAYQKGIINREEYDKAKKRIIDGK